MQSIEPEILKLWKKHSAFVASTEMSSPSKEYIFYDGPPFATGLPHYGHILSGTLKDTVTRYYFGRGHPIERRFGWDCHGLPVEHEIDKQLGITSREQVIEMGIGAYNVACRSIVDRYTSEWKKTVERMGRWIDFDNSYRTMDLSFMEGVWTVFKRLWDKRLVYEGYRVMPCSTACCTPLSNFEANQNYKEVLDPSVLVEFMVNLDGIDCYLVAWTTTPWTLTSNLCLLVNENIDYRIFTGTVKNDFNFKNEETVEKGKRIAVDTINYYEPTDGGSLIDIVQNKDTLYTMDVLSSPSKYYVMATKSADKYFNDIKTIKTIKGSSLLNSNYEPIYDCFLYLKQSGFFRVLHADFVSDDGTGVVHCAPGFGEDDYKALVGLGIIPQNGAVPSPLDERGCFTAEVPFLEGKYFKDADKIVLEDLKNRKVLLSSSSAMHRYPFCWRSDTPLVYKLVPNWFIKVSDSIDKLLRYNEEINWIPSGIKYKKFHNWLENAKDWSISRNRFWGTPIPLWQCGNDFICISSVEELERYVNNGSSKHIKITDIHREFIDHLEIKMNGKTYKRIDEVFDCWFESGSMPFCTKNNKQADFIAEGLDQTRGWFYTLHVLSTLINERPAFKNVICSGIVLAEDGRKMSKRLKNYPDVNEVFDKYGADALRMYLLGSPVVVAENLNFVESGLADANKNLGLPWMNSLAFLEGCEKKNKNVFEQFDILRLSPELSDVLKHSTIIMDEWIVNKLNICKNKVDKDMAKYYLNNIYSYSVEFMEFLTNWYIRMNRKEVRKEPGILKYVLKRYSVIMAPFMPFFSEHCYQKCLLFEGKGVYKCCGENNTNLGDKCGNTEYQYKSARFIADIKSVHKVNNDECQYKSVHFIRDMNNYSIIEDHPFDSCMGVIEGIRMMRELKGISLKTPIKKVKIVSDVDLITALKKYENTIKSECFILELDYEQNVNFEFEVKIKPNYIELRKDMETMKSKLKTIKENKYEEILEAGIKENEIIVERSVKGVDGYFKSFKGFSVLMDLAVTEEMKKIKRTREFYSFVQRQRKLLGLKVEDDVSVVAEGMEDAETNIKMGKGDEFLGIGEWYYDGKVLNVYFYLNGKRH